MRNARYRPGVNPAVAAAKLGLAGGGGSKLAALRLAAAGGVEGSTSTPTKFQLRAAGASGVALGDSLDAAMLGLFGAGGLGSSGDGGAGSKLLAPAGQQSHHNHHQQQQQQAVAVAGRGGVGHGRLAHLQPGLPAVTGKLGVHQKG